MKRTLPLFLLAACAAAPADPPPQQAAQAGPTPAELAAEVEALRARVAPQEPARTAPLAETGDADLDEAARRLARRRDMRASLAEQYVDMGRRDLELGRADSAAAHLATALDLEPGNRAARDELRLALALTGDGPASLGAGFQDEVGRVKVKREQLRLEVEDELEQADAALARGDYEEAIQRLRLAELMLKANPWLARNE